MQALEGFSVEAVSLTNAVRYPVGANLMISETYDFARCPPYPMLGAAAFYFGVHRLRDASERLITHMYIVGVTPVFQGRRAGFIVAVQAGHVPVIAQMHHNIRFVMNNSLRNPVEMIERYAWSGLGIWNDEVTTRRPSHPVKTRSSVLWRLQSVAA